MVEFETVDMMHDIGGNFARQIALAWFAADAMNRSKLEAAFADLFSTYADLAKIKRMGEV